MELFGKPASYRRIFLYVITTICAVMIIVLVPSVISDMRRLQSAVSDNTQWTLSQAEVEGVEFQRAVERAKSNDSPDLENLRLKFDVFYGRIAMLSSGRLYAKMERRPEISEPLKKVGDFLEELVPVIDGSDAQLIAQLDRMSTDMREIRVELRDLTTSGLYHFAQESDSHRSDMALTLSSLALLTLLLIAALVFMVIRSNRISRQTEDRGRELRIAYSRANTILSTSLDAAVVTDISGNIIDFNPAAERVFQYTVDEVRGHNITEIMIPDHLRGMHREAMERYKETGVAKLVGSGRVRIEALRRDGKVFPVELALEMGKSGRDEYFIAFVRDISHRVSAEKELVNARDKALAGEKAKADFLAMMSHEIRTPLNGILGNLALLHETRLTKQQKRYIHNMDVSGKLLMSHVDSVLDIARFEAGVTQGAQQPLHLGQKLQDIVSSQSTAAEANGNLLEWSWVGAPATWVMTDISRLQQVLLNLVGNAIKFTQGGRISIEAECVGRDSHGRTEIEFRIIDTGVGIKESDQSRIFEDFQMAGTTSERKIGGTGLGLSIARRFTHALDGEIGVESTLGEGSVFWVRIPLEEIYGPVDIPEKTTKIGIGKHARKLDILVVEDNEINLNVTRELLELMGHQVTEARDGLQGVRKAANQKFDLILMDISMPVMDGLEATRTIREGDSASNSTPIIAFSANVLPESRDLYMRHGMSGFLSKPLRKDELQKVLGQLYKTQLEIEPSSAPESVTEPDVFEKFRVQFQEETDQLLDWLETQPTDLSEVEMQSHKIAGSAAAFDHLSLRDALLQVEMAARDKDEKRLRETVDDARKLWNGLQNREPAE